MDHLLAGFVIAACLTGATALFTRLFPAGWRVPPRRFVAMAFLLGLVCAFASSVFGPVAASEVALVAAAITTPILAMRLRRARAFERALGGLRARETRERSVGEIERLLGFAPPRPGRAYRKWARLTQHVAGTAARSGFAELAIRWLDRVDDARADADVAVARTQVLVGSCIVLRDRERARRELARAERPVASPMWERALVALEVLLEALDGDPAIADERARAGLAVETEPTLRVTWLGARAHALAAMGHREEAVEALRAMQAALPKDAMLERVARHGGPASRLAETLLADRGAAYR